MQTVQLKLWPKHPSETENVQCDGENVAGTLSSDSEYHSREHDLNSSIEDVPAVQNELDSSSITVLLNPVDCTSDDSFIDHTSHVHESLGNIVVPNESSVFSMPLAVGHSVAEISEIRKRRIQSSANNL